MPSLRAHLVAVLAVALTLKAAVAAPVDQKKEMQARKAFAAGEWAQALDLFAQLYAETLHPVYLRNIGRCHQKRREPDKAIEAFRDYLAKAKSVEAPERTEIKGYIAEMEKLRDELAQKERASEPPPPAAQALPPAPLPPLPPQPIVQIATTPPSVPEPKPFYTRWWFWTAVGVVVVGGVAVALMAGRSSDPCPAGVKQCQ